VNRPAEREEERGRFDAVDAAFACPFFCSCSRN
jgi:hypothetical protein